MNDVFRHRVSNLLYQLIVSVPPNYEESVLIYQRIDERGVRVDGQFLEARYHSRTEFREYYGFRV